MLVWFDAFRVVLHRCRYRVLDTRVLPGIGIESILFQKDRCIVKRTEDPLLWWSQRTAVYPQLHKLARRHLGVPATSVPSERLFSTAGELISQRRTCLKPKNVNNLLFFNKSLKNN